MAPFYTRTTQGPGHLWSQTRRCTYLQQKKDRVSFQQNVNSHVQSFLIYSADSSELSSVFFLNCSGLLAGENRTVWFRLCTMEIREWYKRKQVFLRRPHCAWKVVAGCFRDETQRPVQMDKHCSFLFFSPFLFFLFSFLILFFFLVFFFSFKGATPHTLQIQRARLHTGRSSDKASINCGQRWIQTNKTDWNTFWINRILSKKKTD